MVQAIEQLGLACLLIGKNGRILESCPGIAHLLRHDGGRLPVTTLFEIAPELNLFQWTETWKELQVRGWLERTIRLMQADGGIMEKKLFLQGPLPGEEPVCLAFTTSGMNRSYGPENSPAGNFDVDDRLALANQTLNQSPDMICWFNQKGEIIYFNDTILSKLSFKPKTLSRKKFFDLLPDWGKKEFTEVWEQLESEKHLINNLIVRTSRGKAIPADVLISIVTVHGEKMACCTIRDITLKKKRETALSKALEEVSELREKLEQENIYLRSQSAKYQFENIVTNSERYKKVLGLVKQVADTDATVLLLGETGTGKELLANALHHESQRADEAFIKVNCSALPKELIESELFGHEEGAFTGATQKKPGRFELADKGTIFLDEIGEIPLELQSKLLRVLQDGTFERVGGQQTIQTDVRVIAATNRNLEKMAAEGDFRKDLFYRINVFPIENIPLRERPEDIPPLVRHFTDKFSRKMGKEITQIPKKLIQTLSSYDFPGNIRELENIVERGVIITRGKSLNLDLSLLKDRQGSRDGQKFPSLEEVQKVHIVEALQRTNWRVSGRHGAARLLQMNDKTLFSRMRKLGIKREDHTDIP